MSEDKFKVYADDYASLKTLSISSFLGVDYYSPQFNVADYRAIDMKNMAYKSGVVQVRNGYEDLLNINEKCVECNTDTWIFYGDSETKGEKNPTTIHGIYEFLSSDGQTHTLMHIGHIMYEVKFPADEDDEFTISSLGVTTNNIKKPYYFADNRSSAFVKDEKLYVLDGDKYKYIYFQADSTCVVKSVEEDEDTYIPTTTIGIVPANSSVSSRQVLDDVNLLTMWRKNTFITGLKDSSDDGKDTTWTYYLDTYCCDTATETSQSMSSDGYKNIEIEIEIAVAKETESEAS